MKHLLWGACAALAIACGGGAKTTTEPKPATKSACAVAAENSVNLLASSEGVSFSDEQKAGITRVITERCEADKWPDAAVACLTDAKTANDELEACGEMLTDEQQKATTDQLEREKLTPGGGEDDAAPKDSKPPPAPGGGGAPPPPDDPCGGGA